MYLSPCKNLNFFQCICYRFPADQPSRSLQCQQNCFAGPHKGWLCFCILSLNLNPQMFTFLIRTNYKNTCFGFYRIFGERISIWSIFKPLFILCTPYFLIFAFIKYISNSRTKKYVTKNVYEKALAVETAPDNIRVNCVAPGIVKTKVNS